MAKFMTVPVAVEAEQYIEGKQIPNGVRFVDRFPYVMAYNSFAVYLNDGDWVISDPSLEAYYVCGKTEFAERFTAEDEASSRCDELMHLLSDCIKLGRQL